MKNIKKMKREELYGILTRQRFQDKYREDEQSFYCDVSSDMSLSLSCAIKEEDAVCFFCNGKYSEAIEEGRFTWITN